ncbi:hypothetical protein [Candidatus Poriferisodalis sp.]|uniref:hypothetical protein n=1 Tax=Candidatus Poriferisodalis sp. TaxID=3101277 RepID=UPI003B02C40A
MATPAAAIALVIVVIASWRVLSGGEPATQTASSLRPANVPIGSSTSTVAAEFGTLDPDGTGLIEPDADSTSRASPPTTLSTDDSTGSRVTLLYGTARPECSEAGTPQSADGEAADIDCAEPSSAAVPDHGPDADLLTLPSGQWALMDGDDLPRLSCDVVVLHYGDLSIESGQPAAAAPQGDASE